MLWQTRNDERGSGRVSIIIVYTFPIRCFSFHSADMKFFKSHVRLFILALNTLTSCLLMGEDAEWTAYKVQYGKNYTVHEELMRRGQFLKTHKKIVQHNASKKLWTLAHNVFSDWTDEEQNSLLTTVEPSNENYKSSRRFEFSLDRQTAKTSVDLRNDGCMPSVKKQGHCKSCWAFAAVSPVEYQACKKSRKLTRFSEQQLVDCDLGNGGCHRGFYSDAWHHLQTYGMFTEDEYPYRGDMNETCPYSMKSPNNSMQYRPKVWGRILGNKTKGVTNADAMTQAITRYGPIASGLSTRTLSGKKLLHYKGGIFDDEKCSKKLNHAVVIVGYGRKYDIDYWIVRNSWGERWGQDGHFLVRRGVNRCGIEKRAYYVSID